MHYIIKIEIRKTQTGISEDRYTDHKQDLLQFKTKTREIFQRGGLLSRYHRM